MEPIKTEIEMAIVPESKIVLEASVARKLLKDGYKVIDIKPKRNHVKETIFVFETADGFMEKLDSYMEEFNERKSKKK